MRLLGSLLLGLALACGGAAPVVNAPTPARGPDFAKDEDRVLHLLASADARFAHRAGIVSAESELRDAGVKAILEEDTTTMMEGGRADLFSFDARARALDSAAKLLARYNQKDAGNGLEIERLGRLVEAERARLSMERELPRGAATLFVGLASTWPANVSPAEAEQHDARLAKRFDQVTASLGAMSPEERDELEASLDPIEAKLSAAFGRSQLALVRLRVKLGEVPVDAQPRANPAALAKSNAEERLRALEVRLRDDAKKGAPSAPIDTHGECRLAGTSELGKLVPPPERQTLCFIIKRLETSTPSDALHDQVVLALWAIRFAKGMTATVAISEPRPLAQLPPHDEAKLTRDAALRFDEVIATALAIEWLTADGNAAKRAAAWDAFGDGPVDLAIRELSR